MTTATTSGEIARWVSTLQTGDTYQIAQLARETAEATSKIDTSFRFTLYDKYWRAQGDVIGWIMEASGTDPRNTVPTARLTIKADCPFWQNFAACRNTMVGLTVETAGQRYAFYVKTFTRKYDNGELTGIVELKGIWDILNYLIIWPSWYLPIQTQPFSHAVFIWGLQTVLESMVAECALRIQSGLWDFVNNAGSLNPDVRTWFSGILNIFNALGSGGLNGLARILRTPIYVKRTNPFLDTSGLIARTVRMESCATVITDITKAYGVDTRMDLWLPGDPQPDAWAHLDTPTYVFSTVDRSQITGPTGTVLDSVLRTVVDLEGSLLGGLLDPFLNPSGPNPALPEGAFTAEVLGINFVSPYAIVVVPDAGKDANILSAEIADHTPEGWQHIIGGRSPKWLNDLMNATTAWLIDSISIIIGFTGIPSDILAGFLNNSFLAFQLMQHYERRQAVGPYHPGIETFTATSSAPYNIETIFGFINKLWDTKGYTSAMVRINVAGPKAQYALGRDIFKGGLMSVVFDNRKKMLTDYIENVMWRITPTERELLVQVGDGRRDEAPLAKHQRFITGLFEAYNVLTLAPQSG